MALHAKSLGKEKKLIQKAVGCVKWGVGGEDATSKGKSHGQEKGGAAGEAREGDKFPHCSWGAARRV